MTLTSSWTAMSRRSPRVPVRGAVAAHVAPPAVRELLERAVSLRKDELHDAPSSRHAERDAERCAVPRHVRQDDDQRDEGDCAKSRDHARNVPT